MRAAIVHLRKSDPVIARIIERTGPYRIQYRPPDYSTLARSIVYQQLSGKAAGTIYGRFEAALPRGVTAGGVLKLQPERMREIGLSAQKCKYLLDLSEKTRAGIIRFRALPGMSDEDVVEHLTQVKGVGVWTAQMFLIFALRRTDILPTGDLGIQNAMQKAYALESAPKPQEVERIAIPWRPYASVASWYLWRSLDNVAAL
jgi:DNA-3-methyladenine glycosylase II